MPKVLNIAVAFDINKKTLEAKVFSWLDTLTKADLKNLKPNFKLERDVEVHGVQNVEQVHNLFQVTGKEVLGLVETIKPDELNIETVISSGGEVIAGTNTAHHNGISIAGYGEDKVADYGKILENYLSAAVFSRFKPKNFNLTTIENGLDAEIPSSSEHAKNLLQARLEMVKS